MSASEKTWTQWEAELDETFRKWWPAARDHAIVTTWQRNAAGKRRAMRATNDPAERRVTLTFAWRVPSTLEMRRVQITAEKRDRAVDNLAAVARACEWLRMASVRDIYGIVTIMLRQMSGVPSTGAQGSGSQQGQQHTSQQRPPLSSGPYATLHLTNDAPLAVAEAAYRAALREAHPDVGGDHERAKALNAAIAMIRSERAAEYAARK